MNRGQVERYSRQIILPGVGAAGQRALLEAKVAVVGAGGLGSPALLYLAAAGVGTLGVVDDDAVELSNLQRQVLHKTESVGAPKATSAAARLRDLNPGVRLETHGVRLNLENARALLEPYDLVLDGSDNLPTRYLISDACVALGIPFLYGALAPFEGQLSLLGAAGPCYRCVFPEAPPAGSVLSCAQAGVLGPLAGVIGSMMAAEALKHLLGLGDTLEGKLRHYDALSGELRTVKLRRDPACPSCSA